MDFPTYAIKDIRKLQLEDDELEKIIICFEQLDHPDLGNWTGRGYLMESGVLFRYAPDQETEDAQLVIPAVLREHVLKIYHDSPTAGHYGVERTINKIRSKYHWKGMRKYIAEYVRYCNECQKFKPSNLKPSGLIKTPVMQQRFEVLAIDLFGPLPITAEGYKWILIIEDTASRWVELFPLCVATAEACAKVLISDIFMRYGLPRRMISDNGSQFISDVMQHVSQCFHITQNLIPLYHPEANPVERKNRDLKVQLAILTQTDHTRWAENISSIRFALNTTKTDSTGQTPAFVTFGRELRVLEDVAMDIRPIIESENFIPQITPYLWRLQNKIKEVRDHNENQQDKRKAGADKSRRLGRQHKVGDLVLVQSHLLSNASKKFSKKFAPRRDGPYRVSKVISSTTFELETADRNKSVIGRYHTSALTPYAGQENSSEPIVRKKGRRRRSELPSRRFSSPEGEHVARQKSE